MLPPYASVSPLGRSGTLQPSLFAAAYRRGRYTERMSKPPYSTVVDKNSATCLLRIACKIETKANFVIQKDQYWTAIALQIQWESKGNSQWWFIFCVNVRWDGASFLVFTVS